MKYRFVSMYPSESGDSVITLYATPNWLEQQFGARAQTVRYFGTGQDWREGSEEGPDCGWLMTDWLYEIWNEHWDFRKGAGAEREIDAAT